jgi:hypothetical protein
MYQICNICVHLCIFVSPRIIRRDPDDKSVLSDGDVTSAFYLLTASPSSHTCGSLPLQPPTVEDAPPLTAPTPNSARPSPPPSIATWPPTPPHAPPPPPSRSATAGLTHSRGQASPHAHGSCPRQPVVEYSLFLSFWERAIGVSSERFMVQLVSVVTNTA